MVGLATLSSNAVVGGDFRVVSLLGTGGMGAVYVAEQLSTGKRRALKVMHPSLVADPVQRARFGHEARVGSTIASDHVVEVIAAGIDDAMDLPWLAMELLDGEDLATHVARHGALDAKEAERLLRQLCHALGAAHGAGVIHRDIKPQNVYLAKARTIDAPTVVKVLDFGIAKLLASSPSTNTALVGSPAWMAPEQSDPRARATPATDVWAVGLLTFWMLTGRSFWLSANDSSSSLQAIMRECLVEPIPRASERAAELDLGGRLPRGFDTWFARCVDREPQARFSSIAELMVSLDLALAQRALESDATCDAPSPTELGALSTQQFVAEQGLPVAASGASPSHDSAAARPEPTPALVLAAEATTMSPHRLATGSLPAAPASGRNALVGSVSAGLLMLVISVGAVAYWAGRRGAEERGASSAQRATDVSTPAPTGAATLPLTEPRPEPTPIDASVNTVGTAVPVSFDATAFEPQAQQSAATVVTAPQLTTILATGVTPDGLVDLSNPAHQVSFSYRAARDDRCAFVRVVQGKHQVWSLVPEACVGAKLGPPRCSFAEVVRKALGGMTVTSAGGITLKYGSDIEGKPSWAFSWGDALNVSGIADDCASPGG